MKDDDTPYPGAGGYALLWPNRLFIDRMFPHREKKSQFWKQSNQQIKMAGFICLDVGSDVGTQSKNECFTYAVRILVLPSNLENPGSHTPFILTSSQFRLKTTNQVVEMRHPVAATCHPCWPIGATW